MKLVGKKLTVAILAGLMGTTAFGLGASTVEAEQVQGDVSVSGSIVANSNVNVGKAVNAGSVNSRGNVTAQGTVSANGNITAGKTIRGNNVIGNNNVTAHNQVVGEKGVIDQSTENSTTEYGVVKKDNTVGQNLNALDERVTNVKNYLQNNIDAEATARDQAVAQERAERKGADAAQDKRINEAAKGIADLNKNVADGFDTINKNVGAITDQLNKNDQAEAATRAAADSQLNTTMTSGFATIQGQQDEQDAQIAKNKKDIQTNAGNIQNNTKAIEANSDKLDNHEERIASNEKNIETNAESIKKETNDRIDAVNGLQTNIDEVSGQVDALQKDSATVKDAATIINDNKDAIENIGNHEKRLKTVENTSNKNAAAIGSEAQTRYAADQKLQKNIDAEADARDQADRNLQNQISNNSTSINDLYGRYSSLKTDINKVGARSAALAGLHPLDFDPANKLNFAVASGSFKGENSVALGAFYRPNENIMFSAASTMGDSDNAYTFGLSFKIGPSSAKTKTTSPDAEELYKVVGELQDQLAAQQKEIEQLKANKAK